MTKILTETGPLKQVFMRATAIILDRGYAPEYSFRSGAPVDLPRALQFAERDVGYSTKLDSPAELLADWRGKPLHLLSREFDQDDALDFLEDAVLAIDDIAGGQRLEVEEEAVLCAACEKPIERRRGRQRYHTECKPKEG